MSDSQQQSRSKLQGNLIALAVVAILVLAPIGSYLYLRKGFEYRLESLDQLVEKKAPEGVMDHIEKNAPFAKNARLIHLPGSSGADELNLVHQIDDQIVDRERFDIVSFSRSDGRDIKREITFLGGTDLKAPEDIQFMLLDTANAVRGLYAYREDLGKELIRHLSVVVPVPRRKPVKLVRNNDQ